MREEPVVFVKDFTRVTQRGETTTRILVCQGLPFGFSLIVWIMFSS